MIEFIKFKRWLANNIWVVIWKKNYYLQVWVVQERDKKYVVHMRINEGHGIHSKVYEKIEALHIKMEEGSSSIDG